MAYKFFDKEFLVLPDDEDITGKKVFYNDNLPDLIKEVEQGDLSNVATLSSIVVDDDEGCFGVGSARWRIAYYDPNYEAKVAYSQGKQIQYRTSQGEWVDVVDKPLWCVRDGYRVKPEWYVHPFVDKDGNCIGHPFYKDRSNKTFVSFEGTEAECDKWIEEHTPKTRRMTNRELARWLAEGKGQKMEGSNKHRYCTYAYNNDDDLPCRDNVMIRAWNEEYWHEPLVEVKE